MTTPSTREDLALVPVNENLKEMELANTTPTDDSAAISKKTYATIDENNMDENGSTDSATDSVTGYKKTLYRGLGAIGNFAFGFTEVAILASLVSQFGTALGAGGPVTLTWGWIVTWTMTMVIAFSMAEICAAYPCAGGVYLWTAQLVPAEKSAFASYVCGWLNIIGNTANNAAYAFTFALFLNGAIEITGGAAYDEEQTVGVSIAVMSVWSLLNVFRVDSIGWITYVAAMFQIGSIIMIIIVVLTKSEERSDHSYVWEKYRNTTGFKDDSYVVCLGLLASMYIFSGYDASGQMAEETEGDRETAPWGIINTCFATGIGGLGMILALLYATPRVDDVTNTDDGTTLTTNAVINTFYIAAGEEWAQILSWVVVVNLFFAGVSSVAVTSRITYALMRDNGLPFSEFFSRVNPTFSSPVNCIIFVCFFGCLLQLLPLNADSGVAAFNSIVSLSTICYQLSYAVPILMKLIYQPKNFPKTNLDLGAFSIPLGFIASTWLLGSSCFFFFPASYPITNNNMNWVVVVLAGVVLLLALNWQFNGRYYFKGPHRIHG